MTAVKAPAEAPVIIPPVPVLPTTWTAATIAAFIGAAAAFILGILTSSGVVLPASVSTEVQVWSGVLTSLAGALTPLFVLVSKNSLAKVALTQGVAPEVARRL